MHIYFSGIGGAGLAGLAQLAQDRGYEVTGSDLESNRNTKLLSERGIKVHIGQTAAEIAKSHQRRPIDWLVATSALPNDHPELQFAYDNAIRISKRDQLINHILNEKKLKLIAVSGTHGKTTTTAMLVWLFKQLNQPLSYIVGTNLSFGASGQYQAGSEYFVFEADEFDRNFLAFRPYASVIPALEYDHSDTYPTVRSYEAAFMKFISQSHCTYTWEDVAKQLALENNSCLHIVKPDSELLEQITLMGKQNRQNGTLSVEVMKDLTNQDDHLLLTALNKFPGSERRMEKLADNLYSDYAHLPAEIRVVIQMAGEISKNIIVVYQPHQNIRQHEIQNKYGDAFKLAKKVYWLPTYLSREDPKLKVLAPPELVSRTDLDTQTKTEIAEMNDELAAKIKQHMKAGDTVIVMGAGSIDEWARKSINHENNSN